MLHGYLSRVKVHLPRSLILTHVLRLLKQSFTSKLLSRVQAGLVFLNW